MWRAQDEVACVGGEAEPACTRAAQIGGHAARPSPRQSDPPLRCCLRATTWHACKTLRGVVKLGDTVVRGAPPPPPLATRRSFLFSPTPPVTSAPMPSPLSILALATLATAASASNGTALLDPFPSLRSVGDTVYTKFATILANVTGPTNGTKAEVAGEKA